MVSNLDRITKEIQTKAVSIAADHDLDAERLVNLTMIIVDLEDQHRTQPTSVKKKMEDHVIAMTNSISAGNS